ncbi:MAG: sugar phosphate isomerase/epimerase family protein [Bacillota bacterium]|nr:sugar phosphate isomerase/epimerase [Bacillota bacterium]HOB91209.1 sugar phosphate isomerase/epimerase family protein [Bacillota bacterium]HPZ54336.1 sugar phosphate isomerase/epimerase family protein [Bacillota bacterium]HQD17619.1 sugar phosphate isomerase/epimerase family protein [Bacillota bacterium]
MRIGVFVLMPHVLENGFQAVRDLGVDNCQLGCWDMNLYTDANAEKVRNDMKRSAVDVTTLWAGWPGPAVWDFVDGPRTLGVVPREYRAARLEALKAGARFAATIGVRSITTHVGFIPENMSDPLYTEVVEAVREIGSYCRDMGLEFWFETGQETPITLKRLIKDTGLDNLGINLDPANLLMYGKANPVDALDVFGTFVKGVHAKDGDYPTDPNALGREYPIGHGRVDFRSLILKLAQLGFQGSLTIEREISGPQQYVDIKAGRDYLQAILDELPVE